MAQVANSEKRERPKKGKNLAGWHIGMPASRPRERADTTIKTYLHAPMAAQRIEAAVIQAKIIAWDCSHHR